jgi:hypothetical protein
MHPSTGMRVNPELAPLSAYCPVHPLLMVSGRSIPTYLARTATLQKHQHEALARITQSNTLNGNKRRPRGSVCGCWQRRRGWKVDFLSSASDHPWCNTHCLSEVFLTIFVPYACALVHDYTCGYMPSGMMVDF